MAFEYVAIKQTMLEKLFLQSKRANLADLNMVLMFEDNTEQVQSQRKKALERRNTWAKLDHRVLQKSIMDNTIVTGTTVDQLLEKQVSKITVKSMKLWRRRKIVAGIAAIPLGVIPALVRVYKGGFFLGSGNPLNPIIALLAMPTTIVIFAVYFV